MHNRTFDAPAYDESDGLNVARGILFCIAVMAPIIAACALVIWWLLR